LIFTPNPINSVSLRNSAVDPGLTLFIVLLSKTCRSHCLRHR
jgi:hypothetical protein